MFVKNIGQNLAVDINEADILEYLPPMVLGLRLKKLVFSQDFQVAIPLKNIGARNRVINPLIQL